MRSLFLGGATIVDPVNDTTPPSAVGVETFIKNVRDGRERDQRTAR